MAHEKQSGIKSVQITGRHLGRITATEVIGGVVYRITLEQDQDGRYHEVACIPLRTTSDPAQPAG